MIGVIGEPEQRERLAKSFRDALFECLFEALEFIPVTGILFLCLVWLGIFGTMIYYLIFDPKAVDVASRLDALSIDPRKWFPGS